MQCNHCLSYQVYSLIKMEFMFLPYFSAAIFFLEMSSYFIKILDSSPTRLKKKILTGPVIYKVRDLAVFFASNYITNVIISFLMLSCCI